MEKGHEETIDEISKEIGNKMIENNKENQSQEEIKDEGIIKIILLVKKVKLGYSKFDEEELMIDVITNTYTMIKS